MAPSRDARLSTSESQLVRRPAGEPSVAPATGFGDEDRAGDGAGVGCGRGVGGTPSSICCALTCISVCDGRANSSTDRASGSTTCGARRSDSRGEDGDNEGPASVLCRLARGGVGCDEGAGAHCCGNGDEGAAGSRRPFAKVGRSSHVRGNRGCRMRDRIISGVMERFKLTRAEAEQQLRLADL